MKALSKIALGGAASLAFMATAASAEVVCNSEGDCWHVRTHYSYRPDYGVRVYPDNWRWAESERHYRWREHDGRGYWRNGLWIGF